MIRDIPEFQHRPVERPEQVFLEEQEHYSKKLNKEIADRNQNLRDEIEAAVRSLKSSAPNQWKILEEKLVRMFFHAHLADKCGPLDFLAMQKENKLNVDSSFWALQKAYFSGQKDILDSLFRVLYIKLDGWVQEPAKKNKLTFCEKVVKFFTRS